MGKGIHMRKRAGTDHLDGSRSLTGSLVRSEPYTARLRGQGERRKIPTGGDRLTKTSGDLGDSGTRVDTAPWISGRQVGKKIR